MLEFIWLGLRVRTVALDSLNDLEIAQVCVKFKLNLVVSLLVFPLRKRGTCCLLLVVRPPHKQGLTQS